MGNSGLALPPRAGIVQLIHNLLGLVTRTMTERELRVRPDVIIH